MTYTVEKYVLGVYMANCYVIKKDNHALLIDPGSTSRRLLESLQEQNIIVDGILLTHGHFDHIGGVDYFASKLKCPVYIDEEDKDMLTNTKLNCSLPGREVIVNSKVETYQNGVNKIKDFTFEVIYAPGHTHGSILLRFDSIVFSGDVLFERSIGRTDLPGGSNGEMMNSLEMIHTLDPSYIVYPGHGNMTTIMDELKYNPFL